MKLVILLLIILSQIFTAEASVAPKIVLLTSLYETKEFSREKNKTAEERLENKFRDAFKGQTQELQIIHRTSPEELWKILNDKRVVAIFWVSHSKKEKTISGNMKSPATIRDAFGNDVKELFKRTTPNLRFLAVIGCEGKGLFDQYRSEGRYSENLVISASEKKVSAVKGLKKSLQEIKYLNLELSSETHFIDDEEVLTFVADDTNNVVIKIEMGTEILSVRRLTSNLFQVPILKNTFLETKNHNITVTLLSNGRLPRFRIFRGGQEKWNLFEKDGVALGGNRNLYLRKKDF